MPSQYPLLNAKDIIKILMKFGFKKISQRGSHMKYTDGIHVVIVPNHNPVPRWTFKNILDMAGISLDEFKSRMD